MRRFLALVVLGLLPACGGGTVAGLGGGSGSGGSSPTTVSNVTVSDSKNSPAEIRFTLAGRSVDAVHIEFLPPVGGEGGGEGDTGEPVEIVTLGANDVSLSKSGETNQFDWAFAGDLGSDFVDGLVVRVRLNNGASAITPEPIAVGNSPPVIAPFSFPTTEVGGVVGMLFTVADTDDTVSLSVEVNVDEDNGFPDGSWEPALPDLGQELGPFMAAASGTTVPFHWDVVGQYGPLDSAVRVRATAVDTADPGEVPLQHQVVGGSLLRVDNNAPPVVTLNVSSFTLSEDTRRGIVVPYTVSDAEGDAPDLVFQWTLEGQPFVDLPDDEALLEQILDDPALREQFRIATPFPMPHGGLARPTGEADTVMLPELGSTRSHLLQVAHQPGGDLSHALDGYELELLRASKIPEPLSPTWAGQPLDGPVAALPVGGVTGGGTGSGTGTGTGTGTSAYVLDRLGRGAWRVSEIDLATGAVLAELASGVGEPDAMTRERGGAALLVAAHDGNFVRVDRVDLHTLDVRAIFEGPGPLPGDTIRGLASVGTGVVLATLGDELLRLDYADPLATKLATLLDGLATPCGVVVDATGTNRIHLAEADYAGVGRVLSLDLDTLEVDTLRTGDGDLDLVSANIVGDSLTVFTQTGPGVFVPTLTLGSTATTDGPQAVIMADLDGDGDLDLASANLGFASLASSSLTVFFQTGTGVFEPLPSLTLGDPGVFGGDPGTTDGSVAVAAADLDGDGDVDLVSANGYDVSGIGGTIDGSDTLTVFFQTAPGVFDPMPSLLLGGPATTDGAVDVAAADLDGDGDIDIVSANKILGTLTVFFQTAPGVFDPEPSLILGDPRTKGGTSAVVATDLDGDGDVDLASANPFDDTVTVFFQGLPGVFDAVPSLTLGSLETNAGALDLAAADLDGDGDYDLVSANALSNTLTVFLQTGPGVFDTVPSLTLENPDAAGSPESVTAADVDGDGDVDLVFADQDSKTLTVFFQRSAGVFEPRSFATGEQATGLTKAAVSVATADLDGDGDADILSANGAAATLTVLYGSHQP